MAQATQEMTYTPAEVVERGKAIYDRNIRAHVETPENIGKLLMVDILTGNWVMGADRIEMARCARAKDPDAVLYGVYTGCLVTEKIGRWRRPAERKCADDAGN